MIIGITGTLAAGKGTVVDYLIEKGFKHFSVRDFLIKELNKRNLPINRDSMVFLANQLRESNSQSYIITQLYEKAQMAGGDCIIESLRTPGEIETLRKKPDFYLFSINADPNLRYKRAKIRASEKDNITYDEFLENEKREMFSNDPNKQNLSQCMKMANFVIINNSTIEELNHKVNKIFENINNKLKRKDYISWDEYFMGVAILSGKRSKDPSTQVGACIVNKENKIVGVGYNGFPIGCSDNDLPWSKEGNFLDTKYAYVCHGELNAILNSMERNIQGGKIYVGLFPCNECAKAIIQSGIKKVIYLEDKYSTMDTTKASKKMLDLANVKYEQMIPTIDKITLNYETPA